jgi:uncharacterized membrane protein
MAVDIILVVVGVAIMAAWVWLLRRIGRTTETALAEGRPMPKWSTNSLYANMAVFGMMLMLCAGIIFIAYGFGLGASFK